MTKDIPRTVYPVALETDDDLEVPEFRTDDDSCVIKIDDSGSNQLLSVKPVSRDRPKSGFGSVVTAIRIARWMAKAYGYASQKKSLYVPQDSVINTQLFV